MFLRIDPARAVPIFAQVMEGVRLAVATGRLCAGDRIPSIRDLAVELRINPNTVARAYQELERAGLIEVRRGLGYFIADSEKHVREQERNTLLTGQIDELVSGAIELGFSPEQLRKALEKRIRALGR